MHVMLERYAGDNKLVKVYVKRIICPVAHVCEYGLWV